MSSIQEHHKSLDKHGMGRCSVPMWSVGVPAGFCDKPAYGKQCNVERIRLPDGRLITVDGSYEGFAPALACPVHGGPRSRVYRDGNKWCAVHEDFIDLQASPAAFGDTPEEARTALRALGLVDGGES